MAVAQLRSADQILLPTIVLGELHYGFLLGSRPAQNRETLHLFCRSPRVQIAPIVAETAERYALIFAYLRQQGRPIPTNDIWIAATAMETGGTLLSADAHFQHIPHILHTLLLPTP